jgi:aminoglycoside phosphotransferase family enzyme
MVGRLENATGQSFTRCWTGGSTARGVTMTKYKDIKDFHERCEKHPDHQTGMISYGMIERRLREEIEELRQYIEQREQSLQKPVAWMHTSIEDNIISHKPADLKKHPERWTALYPAPRPWVGLTDEEYLDILREHDGAGLLAFYTLIEAKLREKNA